MNRKKSAGSPANNVYTVTANRYRDQLDRARRYLARVEAVGSRRDVDFQDDVWGFFQNCWHLKDWLLNDLLISDATKQKIEKAVHAAECMKICHDLTNGTKHYVLTDPIVGARHSHTNVRITPERQSDMDCIIELPDGSRISARDVAKKCMTEWERILKEYNLPIDQIN
jgi:hypothetical protein